MRTTEKGQAAERAAEAFLLGRGLRLEARNWRCKGGEIDLVMREGATLVFVEVRAREGMAFGGAAASITAAKQARVVLAARHYLLARGGDVPCRFDAVLVQGGRLEWLKGAFGA
ncbi:MAG: YraN family protein [Pseudomonadota bacterium]